MKRLFVGLNLLLSVVLAHALDITPGITFTDGQRITAAQLGQLVNQATIQPGFYTGKTINTVLSATDTILVYSSASGTYRRITGQNFLLNNTNWIVNLPEKTMVISNDYFLIYDSTGTVLSKASLADISSAPGFTSYLATNWQGILYLGTTNATYPTNIVSLKTNLVTGQDRLWLYDSVLATNVAVTFSNLQSSLLYAMPLTFGVNLSISNGASVNLIGITAAEVPLRGTNGQGLLARNVSLVVNVAGNGTNGFYPTNVLPSAGWVYAYVISDGTNINGVLSTNFTVPAFPPNFYFASRCLGAAYCLSNSLSTFYQRGKDVWLPSSVMPTTVSTITLYTNYPVSGLTNFQAVVPPIANSFSGSVSGLGINSLPGGVFLAGLTLALNTNGVGEQAIVATGSTNGVGNKSIAGSFSVPVNWTTGPFFKTGATGMTNTVFITGYGL